MLNSSIDPNDTFQLLSSTNLADADSAAVHVRKKMFGNREDLAEFYYKVQDTLSEVGVFRICRVSENPRSGVTLTICNMWRMIKTPHGNYRFESRDIIKDAWVKIPTRKLHQFPAIPFFPYNANTAFWRDILRSAIMNVAFQLGYMDIRAPRDFDDKRKLHEFIDFEKSGIEKKMHRRVLLNIIERGILGKYKKVPKSKLGDSSVEVDSDGYGYVGGFATKNKKNFEFGAIALKREFYKHFYEKEIVSQLMIHDRLRVHCYDYYRYLSEFKAFKMQRDERKNLSPLLIAINPSRWTDNDLFSKKNWVKGKKSHTKVDRKCFAFCITGNGSLKSFIDNDGFKWLNKMSIGVVADYIKLRPTSELVYCISKTNYDSLKIPRIAYASLFSFKNYIHSSRYKHLTHLCRCYLEHVDFVWKSNGYNALKRWVRDSSASNLQNIIHWLEDEGFEAGFPNKYNSWSNLINRASEWSRQQALNNSRLEKELLDLSWSSAIGCITIDDCFFTPITTGAGLVAEGGEMMHCVGGRSYIQQCYSNHMRVFSGVDSAGFRSTFSIYYSDGRWVIYQHLGYGNQNLPGHLKVAGVKLCEEYNQTIK